MKKEELGLKILQWIWDNLSMVNPIESQVLEKSSYYFGLDIYRRLDRIKEFIPQSVRLLQLYENYIFGEDKKAYIQKVLASPYVSDQIALLHLPEGFVDRYEIDINRIRDELKEKIWVAQCKSKNNALDNVLMAQYLYYFLKQGSVDVVEKEYFKDLILDLSNVCTWKYNLVTVSEYKRKIHNSYHFSNPYLLLYWISMCQDVYSILEESDYIVLQNVIENGYKNRRQLSSLSLGLLAASTGNEKLLDQNVVFEEISSHFDSSQGFKEVDTYFNNLQFGSQVLGSSLLNAVVCLESIMIEDKYIWKVFRKKENGKIVIQDSETKMFFDAKLELNQRTIQMRMKNHCMAPFLDEGDEIEVSFDSVIYVGDILVFRHYKGMMMAHRVLDVIINHNKTVYITGADNGSLWEYPVFQKDVVGKVTGIHRRRESVC